MKKDKIYKLETYNNIKMHPGDPKGSPDGFFCKDSLMFIDAGFLSKLSKYFGGGKYIPYDILKFSGILAEKQSLNCIKVYYYTAPPYQSSNPTLEEKRRKDRYDSFVKKLSENKKIIIREGRCQKIINSKNCRFSQKAVDSLMIMDMMSVPLEHKEIKDIILIACDSDFVPVIDYLKKLGISILLYTYFTKRRGTNFSRSTYLINEATKYALISKEDFFNAKLEK